MLPIWEGYDEYSHFAYLQKVAVDHQLPKPDTDTTREVVASLACVPLPWTIRDDLPDIQHVVHDQFWALPAAQREQKEECLKALPPEHRGEAALIHRRLYESQQPPSYYLLLSPIYDVIANSPLPMRVLLLRLAGVLLASSLVPLTYVAAGFVLRQQWMSLGCACFLASMPELFVSLSRVSNEALAVVAGSLLTIAILWWSRRENLWATCSLGVGLGAALLVKAYFLCALLAICLLILLRAIVRRSAAYALKHGTLIVATALLIAGWWYLRTWQLTGSISGEQLDSLSQSLPILTRLKALFRIHWLGTLDSALLTHFWFGGWSFLRFRQAWIYHVLSLLWAFASAGVLVLLLRRTSDWVRRPQVLCLAMLIVCLSATLAYHAFVSFLVIGVAATEGWYLYALVTAECILVPAGLMALTAKNWRPLCFPLLTFLFTAADLLGMHFYLMPYYAGVIRHSAKGTVAPLHLAEFQSVGFSELFARLCVNRAGFLTEPVMILLWALYLLASGIMVAISWMVFRNAKRVASTIDA